MNHTTSLREIRAGIMPPPPTSGLQACTYRGAKEWHEQRCPVAMMTRGAIEGKLPPNLYRLIDSVDCTCTHHAEPRGRRSERFSTSVG